MILGFPPKALRLNQLMTIINPEEHGEPEVIPRVLFSTALYPAAGVTQLTFYDRTTTVPQRESINNGALPAPQFFVIHRLFIDVMPLPTSTLGAGGAVATGVAGAVNDIELLTKVGNGGLFNFSISDKNYLRVPIREVPASGGATGLAQLNSSNVAVSQPELIQAGNNRIPGLGGWPVNGMIVIPPQTNFLGTIDWAAATAVSANLEICVTMYGALYRRVL